MRPWLAIALLCGLTGCVDADERASYDYVHGAILAPSCATSNCHSSLGASPLGTAEAGLQFDDREGAYMVLTGRVCEGEVPPELPPNTNFVVPGDPEGSRLVQLLRGRETFIMPPDTPLPEGEIQAVEAWIRRGAPCD